MNYKPILIVNGEPNSIFLEIFFKSLKFKKIKSPIILISSNKTINLIDVNYNTNIAFKKISKNSNKFIKNCFEIAFKIIKKGITNKFINGPISKKYFLNKKFLGITEFTAENFNAKNIAMLIYNSKLSVLPLTTHLPLKLVSKKITNKLISNKVLLVENFYQNFIGFKPTMAILGLNPHCESIEEYNEDEKIIKPSVKILQKKGIKISGPYSADTIFQKNNRKKFDVIIGMYHDQVLTPIKTIYEYDAINITLGLPFLRTSPDHGPNEKMMGKNLSSPLSLIRAIQFLDKN